MSEYRSDEETVEIIARWWRENGVFLLGTVVLVIAGVLGWNWWQAQSLAQSEGAAALYASWEQASGDERQALADRLRDEYPRSAYRGLIAFDAARRAMDAGDHETARLALEQVLELRLPRQMEDLARIRLARVLLDDDDAEAALAHLDAIVDRGDLSLADELRGDALLVLGREVDALTAYDRALATAESPRPLLDIKRRDLSGRIAGGQQ
ncbi:MAG: hypothetical protein EA417_01535 [Gammaproteobacteria bacterium]|nr:MAG: hypothetical protein EA417_01535 [Gammaproteobacteria bacterium]